MGTGVSTPSVRWPRRTNGVSGQQLRRVGATITSCQGNNYGVSGQITSCRGKFRRVRAKSNCVKANYGVSGQQLRRVGANYGVSGQTTECRA